MTFWSQVRAIRATRIALVIFVLHVKHEVSGGSSGLQHRTRRSNPRFLERFAISLFIRWRGCRIVKAAAFAFYCIQKSTLVLVQVRTQGQRVNLCTSSPFHKFRQFWVLLQKFHFGFTAFRKRKASSLIVPNYITKLNKKIFIEIVE